MFACLYSIPYLPFNARSCNGSRWLSLGCVSWSITGGLSSILVARKEPETQLGIAGQLHWHVFHGYDHPNFVADNR